MRAHAGGAIAGAAAAALAALGLAAGAARADVGTIVLAPDGGAGGGRAAAPTSPADLRRALATAAATAGERAIDDPTARARAAITAGAVPVEDLAAFRRVAEVVQEGWRAYLQVAADYAAARLAAARGDAEDLLALDGGLDVYADVSLRLGAVLDQLGRKDEAADAFRLAAALDPARSITTAEFSPDVVAAFEAARGATVATATAEIGAGDAAGAQLEVDGAAAGSAPARLTLAIGPHVVIARAPGRRARGQAFALPAEGARVDVALDPDGAPGAIAVGAPPDAAAAAIDAATVYGDVDGVVLAAAVWRDGQPALLGQWCGGGPVRCTPVLEVGYRGDELGAAAERLWKALRDARAAARYTPTLPTDARVVRGGGDDERCHVCRSPWLWAGVGAAALAAGVTAAIVAGGGAPQPVVTIDGRQFTTH